MSRRLLTSNVVVCALGNFVDVYDLMLFGIVRVPSLKAIGVPADQLLSTGVLLIDAQMIGMLLGGVLWGVIGDRRGRLTVLFGSIFLYSIANLANAFVGGVGMYAALRLLAGIGLAGELGVAITLVSETLPVHQRGYGTTIVAGVGVMGAIAAALVGDRLAWNTAYVVGGLIGLALLVLRVSALESGMFESVRKSSVPRGDLRMLVRPAKRFRRYIACILIGVPVWFVNGILITFSPELGRELGVDGDISAGTAIVYFFIGSTLGNFISGWLSQVVRSRKKVLVAFVSLTAALVVGYVTAGTVLASRTQFYAYCVPLGFATGYWAVFIANTAEQFGTNLRATVTTSVPNLARGSVVPLTLAFQALIPWRGGLHAALVVGLAALGLAFIALRSLPETFDKDLDYCES